MAEIAFPGGYGHIHVPTPPNKLSHGVKNPGDNYMEMAHELLQSIAKNLGDYAELPAVEDVAYHLKGMLVRKELSK